MAMIETLVFLVSLIIVIVLGERYISLVENMGIIGIDVHKKDKRKVAELGGPLVAMGFLSGLFLFIFYIIYIKKSDSLIELLAAISSILIITIVGIFDDLGVLIKREGLKRVGLKKWQKPLLTIGAAIPLMAIKAGTSSISIPFIGKVDTGIFYSLFLVPIGVVGASNAINLLGGLNGLESSMSFILMMFLGYFSLVNQSYIAAIISFSLAGALLGFLVYNKYPAKIFPGDSLTYLIGATIAVVAIIGNIEKFAILALTPWFLELIIKLKTKLKGECFGKLREDGTLEAPKKCESLTHCIMKLGRFKEWQVVLIFDILLTIWLSVAFVLTTKGII